MVIPSSSPWYTNRVPRCRWSTVASIVAERAQCSSASPNRDTTRGWSWLLQYRLFQPRTDARLPTPERRLQFAQIERAGVELAGAVVEADVLEVEDHVELAVRGVGDDGGRPPR